MSTALFDIGGSKTRVTVSRNGRTFRRPIIYATPRHYAEGIRQLVDAIRVAADGWKVSRVIGCIAAPLDPTHSFTVHESNLPDWYRFPLKRDLQRRFRAAVQIENDAALAGLGEAVYGAGRGQGIVGYITIGTGVGGSRIVGGQFDQSALGFEPGNIIVRNVNGRDIALESYISGAGLERRFRRSPKSVHERSTWREVEHMLALGLVNVSVLWSPHVLVLGGSIGRSTKLHLKNVRAVLHRNLTVFHTPPKITRGTLGDAAALWGGLALLKHR